MGVVKIIRGKKDSNSLFVESNYGLLLFDTGAATTQLLQSDLTKAFDFLRSGFLVMMIHHAFSQIIHPGIQCST